MELVANIFDNSDSHWTADEYLNSSEDILIFNSDARTSFSTHRHTQEIRLYKKLTYRKQVIALHPLDFFVSSLSIVHYNIDGGEQCNRFLKKRMNMNMFSFVNSNVTRKTSEI